MRVIRVINSTWCTTRKQRPSSLGNPSIRHPPPLVESKPQNMSTQVPWALQSSRIKLRTSSKLANLKTMSQSQAQSSHLVTISAQIATAQCAKVPKRSWLLNRSMIFKRKSSLQKKLMKRWTKLIVKRATSIIWSQLLSWPRLRKLTRGRSVRLANIKLSRRRLVRGVSAVTGRKNRLPKARWVRLCWPEQLNKNVLNCLNEAGAIARHHLSKSSHLWAHSYLWARSFLMR